MTRSLLELARRAPRGGFRLVRVMARLDARLREFPIELKHLPGQKVRADLRESVWYQLWRYGSYPWQDAEDSLALRILRRGDVVWDIGANIGYTALVYARAVGPAGRVVAFEPSRRTYTMLARTVASIPNIEPVGAAVSDTVEPISFTDATFLDRSSVSASGARSYQVCSTTLDVQGTQRASTMPQFIKIDVEGHEHAVLRGGAQLIADTLPVLQFEALTSEAREISIALLEAISGGRYRYLRIMHDGSLAHARHEQGPESTNNFLAVTDAHGERLECVDVRA